MTDCPAHVVVRAGQSVMKRERAKSEYAQAVSRNRSQKV